MQIALIFYSTVFFGKSFINPNNPRHKLFIFYNKCNNYLDKFFAKFSLDIKNSYATTCSKEFSMVNGPEVTESFEQDLEIIGGLIVFGIDHIQFFHCLFSSVLAF